MIELNKFDQTKKVQFFYLDEQEEIVTCDIEFVQHDKEDDIIVLSFDETLVTV